MLKSFTNFISGLFRKEQENSVKSSSSSRGWTSEQEKELASLIKARVPKDRIREITGRTTNSINYKLIKMYNSSNVKVINRKLAKV